MKLLMPTRVPFIASPAPPCTTRMTHFISPRGRGVRGTSDNQNTRVDVCRPTVRLTFAALPFEGIHLWGPTENKLFLKFSQKGSCSVATFVIFTSAACTHEGFCPFVTKIFIYIPGNVCFPLGRRRCGHNFTKWVRGPIISIFH